MASGIAVATLGFTAVQVYILRRQWREERRIALQGVSVSWRAETAPDHADPGGDAEWVYKIKIQNPGKMPVDDILITLHLSPAVKRVHYSGRLGKPTHVLTFRQPVLPGGDYREWARRLRIRYDERSLLTETYAELKFRDVEMHRQLARWPREGAVNLIEPEEESL